MEAHPNTVQFAGDYRLDGIILHNHQNEGINVEDKGIDIQKLVVEMNLFESIYKNSMTGSLVIADSINLIGKLPIQGTERLSFKLSTPGSGYAGHNVDCSERTGNPMHIYKLTNKRQINEGTQTYTLHFCSREFLRNIRTKVSETFEGTIDQMVYKILDDENYLDSRQFFSYQKTRNQDKITIPNKSPFRAIDMLCKKALADDSKSVGYLFYQTTKGFNFRSFESMCVNSNGIPRKAKQTFNYMPMNTDEKITGVLNQKDGELVDKITKDYSSVEQYKFINNFHDVAMNQAMGVYGHRVITHNIFNKSYKVSDYHYHNYFDDTLHVDTSNAPAIVETPVDYDNKSVSDYPESRVTVMSTTQFSHDEETGSFGIDVEQDGITEAARVSQLATISSGTNLKLTVKGQSYLAAGDVINFNILSVENKVVSDGALDPQYAGRYVISKIRHRITNDDYVQVLECVKDSVFNAYATDSEESFQGHPHLVENVRGQDINQYDDLDEDLEKGRPIRL